MIHHDASRYGRVGWGFVSLLGSAVPAPVDTIDQEANVATDTGRAIAGPTSPGPTPPSNPDESEKSRGALDVKADNGFELAPDDIVRGLNRKRGAYG